MCCTRFVTYKQACVTLVGNIFPQHPKIKQKVQAAPLRASNVCDEGNFSFPEECALAPSLTERCRLRLLNFQIDNTASNQSCAAPLSHYVTVPLKQWSSSGAARVAIKAVLTTKKRSTGISVCRDLLHTFQS